MKKYFAGRGAGGMLAGVLPEDRFVTIASAQPSGFPTTNWDDIRNSLEGLGAESPSMEQLIRRYLPPLKRLLARKRIGADKAEDILQAFIADKLLTGKLLKRVNAGKGRFRSYLARSLMNFVVEEARKTRPRWAHAVQIDHLEIADKRQALEDYEVSWARQVVSNARDLMHRQCMTIAREDIWCVFQGRLLRPAYENGEPVPYTELMGPHQLNGPTNACNLLTTAKRMFKRCLLQTVAEYAPQDADQEMEKLIRILRQQRARRR